MTSGEQALVAAVEAQRNSALNQVAQMAQLLAETQEQLQAALEKIAILEKPDAPVEEV